MIASSGSRSSVSACSGVPAGKPSTDVDNIADLVTIDGRNHYPQDIEATAAEAYYWCGGAT